MKCHPKKINNPKNNKPKNKFYKFLICCPKWENGPKIYQNMRKCHP